jgi:hypothetical protein
MSPETSEGFLQRISIQSLHMLTGHTLDPITVQEKIEHIAHIRPILGALQILEYCSHNKQYMYVIKFGFSSAFMYVNRFSSCSIRLPDLFWLLKIHSYENGDESKSGIEEGIATWLSRSKIEICNTHSSEYEFPVAEIKNLLDLFEQNY